MGSTKAKLTDHEQFIADMEDAGYEIRDYSGRNFWEGPAVDIERDELQDVIRATKVQLQSDSMGLGMIVYPKAEKGQTMYRSKQRLDGDEDED